MNGARAEVVALLDEMEAALAAAVLDAEALARNRWALARAVIAVDLLRQRDAAAPLGTDCRGFVTRWAGGIDGRADEYRSDGRRLAGDLRRRLAR